MTLCRCIAPLCLAALLSSCTTFRTYEAGVPPTGHRKVRVTLLEAGEQVVLYSPRQIDDRYVGGLDESPWSLGCEECAFRAIPIDSIARFETVGRSRGSGVAEALLILVGLGAAIAMIAAPGMT